MEIDLDQFDLTPEEKLGAKKNVLMDVYSSCNSCEKPELIYITAGPGAGKSTVERHFNDKFESEGIFPFTFNSDMLATYHPLSNKLLSKLMPKKYYRVTRRFVRPVTPIILQKLRESKISVINENTLDHGDADIEQAREFKEAGYKITVNIIATDIFESRLSCFEREAVALEVGVTPRGISKESQDKMYNSFERNVREMERLGLVDIVNVYTRGKTIEDEPVLVYTTGDTRYRDFKDAVDMERKRQRDALFADPKKYYERIKKARETISTLGKNEDLTKNALDGLDELEKDYTEELQRRQELDAR